MADWLVRSFCKSKLEKTRTMALKRQRDDPNEYLGGDLVASFDDDEEDAQNGNKRMTKAERNEARKAANKKWKMMDRKVGSGIDPNPRHSLYYKTQIPDLADPVEWEKFQAALVDPLPVTFRIGGQCPQVVEASLQKSMNNEFKTMRGHFVEIGGVVLKDNIVKPIGWAGRNVWQVAADSPTLARNSGLEPLSKLLLREVELGHVVRQELASMIPAIMLKVEGHHNVLDVCAAPGSKTEQLLCLLKAHSQANNRACTGMVVANDADPIRINTLKRRYARCGSPNLLVTCARAEDLQKMINQPVFDRIVADVPCSGDGTIRKFPHIWRLFRPRMSLELHMVQLQIAIASVLLLKPGGRMVYSTCSINPLEDEAVVAALLKRFWGRLLLVDTKAEGLLPGLITRQGQSRWECSEDIFVCGEPDENSRRASVARLPKLTSTMRPPSPEEATIMHLEYCHRVLPQDNNTGGFFVAVLQLLEESAPTPAAYLNTPLGSASSAAGDKNSVGNKRSKKGQVQEVSAEASMEIMRNLGYNPKHTTQNKAAQPTTSTKTPIVTATTSSVEAHPDPEETYQDSVDVATVYHTLDVSEFEDVSTALSLDTSIVVPSVTTTATTTSTIAADKLFLVKSEALPAVPKKDPKKDDSATTAEKKEKGSEKEKGAFNGIFGSRSAGWLKPSAPTADEVDPDDLSKASSGRVTQYSLVSHNIHTALHSWASGSPTFLRQAGVAIAQTPVVSAKDRAADKNTSGSGSKVPFSSAAATTGIDTAISVYSMLPNGAAAMVNGVRPEVTYPLCAPDFKLVTKLVLESTVSELTDDGEVVVTQKADLSAFFARVAALTTEEDEGGDDGNDSDDIEAAERQLAVMSALSPEALAVLSDAYKQCQLLLQDMQKKGSRKPTTHFLLTCSSGVAAAQGGGASGAKLSGVTTSGAGSGGDKRRLSKAERKKMKIAPAEVKKSFAEKGQQSGEDCIDHSNNSNNNRNSAVLMLQCQYDKRDRRNTVKLLTADDVCRSYVDALSHV